MRIDDELCNRQAGAGSIGQLSIDAVEPLKDSLGVGGSKPSPGANYSGFSAP